MTTIPEPRPRSARGLLFLALSAGALLVARPISAQSCADCDQCMTDCVCQADGSCAGTPAQSGTPCETGNPCTSDDTCKDGTCLPGTNRPDNTPCTFAGLGLCIRNTVCKSGAIPGFPSFCKANDPGDVVMCPAGPDSCHPNICDPQTGQCRIVDVADACRLDPCSTGVCDLSSGSCEPGNDRASCDDGNGCTTKDRCQGGQCVGLAPGATACIGDCNGDSSVTVDEVLLMVNIALGTADISLCSRGDVDNSGAITVDEILAAVNFALSSCPTGGAANAQSRLRAAAPQSA